MREIVFFVASLAGAAILTALAVLNPEAPLLWKNVLIGGIAILAICALALFIEIIRSRIARRQKTPTETVPPIGASHDRHWQFDSQLAGEIAARLRSWPGWQDKIIDVTPEYLWDLFRGRTSMEGDKLAKPFLNKWMVVCGPFRDIRQLEKQMCVTFAFRATMEIVFMYFNEEWRDRLEIIIQDKKIAVVGRIDRIKNDTLQLEDCELVQ